jgi:hypothetical protein
VVLLREAEGVDKVRMLQEEVFSMHNASAPVGASRLHFCLCLLLFVCGVLMRGSSRAGQQR